MYNINIASEGEHIVLLDDTTTPHQSGSTNQSLAEQVAAANPPIGSVPPGVSPSEPAKPWVNPDPIQTFEDSLSWPLIMPKKDFKSVLGEENAVNLRYHIKPYSRVS